MMYHKRMFSMIITLLVLAVACDKDNDPTGPADPTSADREKFIGNWAGSYACGSPADTMIIAIGSGDLDVKITLHAQGYNADVLDGELTEVNVITIPEQTIAYFPGSGEITYANNALSLEQSGFGITCYGTNYVKY